MNYEGPPPRSTRRFLDQIADLNAVARQVCSERDLLLEMSAVRLASRELAEAWERGYSEGYCAEEEDRHGRPRRPSVNPYLPEE